MAEKMLGLVDVQAPKSDAPILIVKWDDGRSDTIDLTGVIARSRHFGPLEDLELFRQVEIINHGDAIAWPNGLDYGADTLRTVADEQSIMGAAEFREAQKKMKLSNQELADVLGYSLAQIKNFRAGTPVPVAVQIAVRALLARRSVLAAHYRPRKPGRPRKGTKAA